MKSAVILAALKWTPASPSLIITGAGDVDVRVRKKKQLEEGRTSQAMVDRLGTKEVLRRSVEEAFALSGADPLRGIRHRGASLQAK